MTSNIAKSKTGSCGERVFVAERSFMLTVWIGVLAIANCLFLAKAIISKDNTSILIISLILIFVYLLVTISMHLQSDIVICEIGISRRAFGVSWQKMRWDNMKVINVFDSYNKTVKNKRSFNIVPSKRQIFSPFGRKIVFSDKIPEWPVFLKMLNQYVDQHHIKIESTVDGVVTSPTQL